MSASLPDTFVPGGSPSRAGVAACVGACFLAVDPALLNEIKRLTAKPPNSGRVVFERFSCVRQLAQDFL
jgi:hypothetical protein